MFLGLSFLNQGKDLEYCAFSSSFSFLIGFYAFQNNVKVIEICPVCFYPWQKNSSSFTF